MLVDILDGDSEVIDRLLSRCRLYIGKVYPPDSWPVMLINIQGDVWLDASKILFVLNNEKPFKEMIMSTSKTPEKDAIFLKFLTRRVEAFLNNRRLKQNTSLERFVRDCQRQYLIC